jgi:hypothetical protein
MLVKDSKGYGMQRVSCPDASLHFSGKSLKMLINSRVGYDYD